MLLAPPTLGAGALVKVGADEVGFAESGVGLIFGAFGLVDGEGVIGFADEAGGIGDLEGCWAETLALLVGATFVGLD